MALDSLGNVHVAWEEKPSLAEKSRILYRRWNGSAWSQAENISQTGGDATTPALTVDPSGNLHAFWEDDSVGNKEIFYRRWNGSVWSPSENISQNKGVSSSPAAAADSQGNVHVVWDDDSPGNAEIMHCVWNGSVWSRAENISQNSAGSYGPGVAVDSLGNVHVVWFDYTYGGNSDILYRRWDGSDWSPRENISDNSGSSWNPRVAADSTGNVHVIWYDNTPGNSEILYRRWDGKAWSLNDNISQNGADSLYPAITADPLGKIHVVWADKTPGKFDIFYRYWNGAAWSQTQNLSQDSGDSSHPAVAANIVGDVHVVWEDDTPGNNEATYRMAASGLALPTPTPTPEPGVTPTATPVPGVTTTPTATVPPALTRVALVAGWNLISFPIRPTAPSVGAVFGQVPAVTRLYSWVYAPDGTWEYALRTADGFVGPLGQIVDGKSYWAFATAPATLTFSPGAPPPKPSYSLEAGWNMIGYTSTGMRFVLANAYLSSLQGKWERLFRYGPSLGWELTVPTGPVNASFWELEAGRGYWLYLTAAGTLTP